MATGWHILPQAARNGSKPGPATSRKRIIRRSRAKHRQDEIVRFEVLGRAADRDLIRALARRLADDSADTVRLRAILAAAVAGNRTTKGGVFAALRRSPLVGADLDLARSRDEPRERTVDIGGRPMSGIPDIKCPAG